MFYGNYMLLHSARVLTESGKPIIIAPWVIIMFVALVSAVRVCVSVFLLSELPGPHPPLRTVEGGHFSAVYTVNGQELSPSFVIVVDTQSHCADISHTHAHINTYSTDLRFPSKHISSLLQLVSSSCSSGLLRSENYSNTLFGSSKALHFKVKLKRLSSMCSLQSLMGTSLLLNHQNPK